MIVTPRIMVRIVAIVVAAMLLQLSFFSQVEVLQTSPDILPAVAVSLGLLGGSLAGAVSGFAIGLLLDCLIVEALGASSMVLLSVGYLAGVYRERFDVTNSLVPPLLCMGLTLLAEASFAALQLMLGVDAPISALIVRDMVIKSIFAFFLGVPIYLGIRRALRPALIEDQAVRRSAQPRMMGA
ncbi:MAG: rod shape-determining protein MreD [Actinomycetota bacterium]